MTFSLVEVDNAIGRTTTKDEGSGVTSLDTNIRSGDVNSSVTYADSGNIDAFGRLRVSEPYTLFDHKQVYNATDTIFWAEKLTGSGTTSYDSDEASTKLQVTTASGDDVIRQTRDYFVYQPGKSLMILMTGVMGAIKTNVTQRIGYFDDDNGIFFEQNGSELRVVRRTSTSGSPVDNAVSQSSWNLDTMDGNGASGVTLDMSLTQIFFMDLEWLGVGRVRTGFVIDGVPIYAHEFLNANNLSVVYMTTPTLPCRYQLSTTGTVASSTELAHICTCVISEGGYSPRGVARAYGRTTAFNVDVTKVSVLTIRAKSGYERAQITPTGFFTLPIADNKILYCELSVGGSHTGGTWVSAGTNSVVEYNEGGTYTRGETIFASYLTAGSSVFELFIKDSTRLSLGADVDGTSGVANLSMIGLVAPNADTYAGMYWEELL